MKSINYNKKIRNYLNSCGWEVDTHSYDSEGEFLLIKNGGEKYFSYIANDDVAMTSEKAKEKMLALENHQEKTKTTIVYAEEFEDIHKIDEFSTVFSDEKEIDYLLSKQAENPNYQHIQLQAHNHIAFRRYLDNPNDKSAFINATGTGKSYLIAKLSQHHYPKKIGILSSSSYILDQQSKLIGESPNIDYMTYNMASIDIDNEHFTKDLDVLLMDEYHRSGADKWGQGVQNIIDLNKDLELIGLSATNIRYLDNYRNMADELFDGNVVNSLPLTDAIAKKILPMPTYVTGIYDIGDTVESYKAKIKEKDLTEEKRNEAIESLSGIAMDWDKFSNASTIISDNLQDYNGKYIVFCESIEHMQIMKEKFSEWIKDAHIKKHGKALDSDINIHEMHSEKKGKENYEAMERFDKADKNDGLNLLFTVDMLNEGKHVKGISGAFLLRRTASPIVFYQQIGRAFTASDNYNPLIIDMVGNVNAIHKNLFSEELAEKVESENKRRESFGLEKVPIEGKIIGYNDNLLNKLSQLDASLSKSTLAFESNYSLLKSYYKEHQHLNVQKKEKYKGENIGFRINALRKQYKEGKLTEKQITQLEEIGFKWSVRKSTFNSALPFLKAYHQEHRHLNIQRKEEYLGEKLGIRVNALRNEYKEGKLTEGEIAQLEEIGFKWNVRKSTFDSAFPLLKAYHQEHGHLNIKIQDEYQGEKLGVRVITLRTKYKEAKLSEGEIAQLEEIGFKWDAQKESLFDSSLPLLKAYHQEHGHLNIKMNDEYQGEKLGNKVNGIRNNYRKGKLSEGEIAQLEEIGFKWDVQKESLFDSSLPLLKAYHQEHGHLNIKIQDEYQGKKLGQRIGNLRKQYKEAKLSESEIAQLKEIGFKWDAQKESLFDSSLRILKAYYQEHGHLNIKAKDEYQGEKLGQKVNNLRNHYIKGKLSEDQITQLKEIGFKWNVRESTFDSSLPLLKAYYQEHGHLNIKVKDEYQGKKLGHRVSNLRKQYKEAKLSENQVNQLEEMLFQWSINEKNDRIGPDNVIYPKKKEILFGLKNPDKIKDKIKNKNLDNDLGFN